MRMKYTISLRVEPELVAWIDKRANAEGRTRSNMVNFLLDKQRREEDTKKPVVAATTGNLGRMPETNND